MGSSCDCSFISQYPLLLFVAAEIYYRSVDNSILVGNTLSLSLLRQDVDFILSHGDNKHLLIVFRSLLLQREFRKLLINI